MKPITIPSIILDQAQATEFASLYVTEQTRLDDHLIELQKQTAFFLLSGLLFDSDLGVEEIGLSYDDSDDDSTIGIDFVLSGGTAESVYDDSDEIFAKVWSFLFAITPQRGLEEFLNKMMDPMTRETVWERASVVFQPQVVAAMQALRMENSTPPAPPARRVSL